MASSNARVKLLIASTKAARKTPQMDSWTDIVSSSSGIFRDVGISEDSINLISITCGNEVKLVDAMWALSSFKFGLNAISDLVASKGRVRHAKSLLTKQKSLIDTSMEHYATCWKSFETVIKLFGPACDYSAIVKGAIKATEAVREIAKSFPLEDIKQDAFSTQIAAQIKPMIESSEAFGEKIKKVVQVLLSRWLVAQIKIKSIDRSIKHLIKQSASHSLIMFEILTHLVSSSLKGELIDIGSEVAAYTIQDVLISLIDSILNIDEIAVVYSKLRTQWALVKVRFEKYQTGREVLPVFEDGMQQRIRSFQSLRKFQLRLFLALSKLASLV